MFNLSEMVGGQQQHGEQAVRGWPKTFIHMHTCNMLGCRAKTTIHVWTWNTRVHGLWLNCCSKVPNHSSLWTTTCWANNAQNVCLLMVTCCADDTRKAWEINFICIGATGGAAHAQTMIHFGTAREDEYWHIVVQKWSMAICTGAKAWVGRVQTSIATWWFYVNR